MKPEGEALRGSELAREEVFVTTKLWNADQGFDAALKGFDHSVSGWAWTTSICTSFTGRHRGATCTLIRGARWRG